MIAPLEQALQGMPWLAGAHRGLADVALLPFVRQFAQVDLVWFQAQALPALQAWLQAQMGDDLFVEVMAKAPQPALAPPRDQAPAAI